jgi:hypothetical protein
MHLSGHRKNDAVGVVSKPRVIFPIVFVLQNLLGIGPAARHNRSLAAIAERVPYRHRRYGTCARQVSESSDGARGCSGFFWKFS